MVLAIDYHLTNQPPGVRDMGDLNKLSAFDAVNGIRTKRFTSQQLMADCLTRIEKREASVRAWAHFDPEYAMAEAKKADQKQNQGKKLGPLHGIPVGIKDVIDAKGMPGEHGSPIFDKRIPKEDSDAVIQLKKAGAIIMGKTVTTELANLTPSKTRNPHDLERSPGGSSSGSAASVADFHVPLALGTQTGGSVIRPASFNGIYGLKPTVGRISRNGMLLQSHTLDTIGVYARNLADLAIINNCLIDENAEATSEEILEQGPKIFKNWAKTSETPKFAFLETPAWPEADVGAKNAVEAAIISLSSACQRESLPAPFSKIIDYHGTVFAAENSHYYGPFLDNQPELLSKKLRDRLIISKTTLASEYIAALNARNEIYHLLEALLDDYDAVLCLAATGAAPIGFETTGSAIFNGLWTYLGVPCLSLPLLTADKMPLGLQLVGKRGNEKKLFGTADWIKNHLKAS